MDEFICANDCACSLAARAIWPIIELTN